MTLDTDRELAQEERPDYRRPLGAVPPVGTVTWEGVDHRILHCYRIGEVKSELMSEHKVYETIQALLEDIPGQSVKELAEQVGDNRTVISGYLRALEDLGYVSSRRVGPAKMYYNNDLTGATSVFAEPWVSNPSNDSKDA